MTRIAAIAQSQTSHSSDAAGGCAGGATWTCGAGMPATVAAANVAAFPPL